MRILLDESLPRKLKQGLPGHEAKTVPEMGWAHKQNGEPMDLAAGKFDVFVTANQNLQYQQNLQGAKLGVIVLIAHDNRFDTLRLLMPKVLAVLPTIRQGDLVEISE